MTTNTFISSRNAMLYRQPGSPESFATIVAGVGTAAYLNQYSTYVEVDCNGSDFTILYRIPFAVDTSAIGTDIVSAGYVTLHSNGANANNLSLADFNAHISGFSSTPGNPFVASDFEKAANVDFGSAAVPGTDDVFNITLNAAGLAAVNTGGITYMCIRLGCDITGTFDGTPANGSSSFVINGHPDYLPPSITLTYAPAPSVVNNIGLQMGNPF